MSHRANDFRRVGVRLAGLCALIFVAASLDAQQFSEWGVAENLGPVINSPSGEQHPQLSPDGLSLYFSSDRAGGTGDNDLWTSRRESVTSQWRTPVPIQALNSPSAEFAPAFDPTGHWLFFGSERDGGCGGRDLWLTYRPNVTDDLGWKPPVNLGCGQLSWPGFDDGPTYFREDKNGTLFFISDRPGGMGGRDVWMVSHRNGGSFSAPVNVRELNSAVDDARPAVRRDGLEFFVSSARVGSVPLGTVPSGDIWVATRSSPVATWSSPINLTSVNTSATEGAPALSDDGTTLLFNSNRPGGQGGLDLWITTRRKVN